MEQRLLRNDDPRVFRSGPGGIHWGREHFPESEIIFVPGNHEFYGSERGDPLNPSFASDLSALLRPPVKLWIHGHTHESMDYECEGTRVVCNPRGYLPQEPNQRFNPKLVLEVSA